jgi:hypothetical protein
MEIRKQEKAEKAMRNVQLRISKSKVKQEKQNRSTVKQTAHVDRKVFIKRGKSIYKRLKQRLEKESMGKVIAVEIESGRYVLGDDELETAIKAREEFPGRTFAFFRVGYQAVHKFRRRR